MSKWSISLACVAATFLSLPVVAQPVPPDAGAPTVRETPGRGHGMQAQLRAFHDRLGITAAQQPQWDAVVAVLRENAQAMRASPAREAIRSGNLTGPQALRAAADLARTRADALQRVVPPVDALYGVLSPEQRQTADQTVDRVIAHRPGRAG